MTGQARHSDVSVKDLVTAIHAKPGLVVIAVTGAGTQALAWLFAQGGASRTVLEAVIPYSSAALNEFTGRQATQHVSAAEASIMAVRALERARSLAEVADSSDEPLLAGVGCTAAIATDRVRKGEDRCHVAFATSDGRGGVMSFVMTKDARDRSGEEELTSLIVLNAVAEAKGATERVKLPLIEGEILEMKPLESSGE